MPKALPYADFPKTSNSFNRVTEVQGLRSKVMFLLAQPSYEPSPLIVTFHSCLDFDASLLGKLNEWCSWCNPAFRSMDHTDLEGAKQMISSFARLLKQSLTTHDVGDASASHTFCSLKLKCVVIKRSPQGTDTV